MAHTPSSYVKNKILKIFQNHHYFDRQPDPKLLAAIDEGRSRLGAIGKYEFRAFQPKSVARYALVKEHFADSLSGSVADIGSRAFELISETLGVTVTGVDKNNATLASFDWDKEKLPFGDRSFDTVLCLDTLEHITDFHTAFTDLLRISRGTVIISLPNCWKSTPREILQGYSTRESYGLPVEKPMDRHRWYMNTEDIEDFMFYNAQKNGFNLTDIVYHARLTMLRHRLLSLLRHVAPRYFKNLVVNTVFVRMCRNQS